MNRKKLDAKDDIDGASRSNPGSLASLLNPVPEKPSVGDLELEGDPLVSDAIAGLLRSGTEAGKSVDEPSLKKSDDSESSLKTDRSFLAQSLPSLRSMFGTLLKVGFRDFVGRFEAAPKIGMLPDVNLPSGYFAPYRRLHARLPVQPSGYDLSKTIRPRSEATNLNILPSGPIPDITQTFRRCTNCQTKETPSWRRCGPNNILLCNACGLYFNEHQRQRPFRIDQHGRTKALRVRERIVHPCLRCRAETPVSAGRFCRVCRLYIDFGEQERGRGDSSGQ